jgi:hypothetical protein
MRLVPEAYAQPGKIRSWADEALSQLRNIPLAPEDLNAQIRANFSLAEEHAKAALDLNPDRMDAYRVLVAAVIFQNRWDDTTKITGARRNRHPG